MGAPGRLIVNRYRLVRALGQGRAGTVWEGHDTLLDRPVAAKEVPPPPGLGLKGRAEFIRRITLSANAATRVANRNLVAVYDVAEDDERLWVIMELLPSRSLAAIVANDGPLPPERVAAIGRRVLDALTAAHAAGLVHGDVRPANVLIGYEGRVALADLGVPVTDGEPPYRAPEGARSGPAADLWALGATLFTAAVGTPPVVDDGVPADELARAPEALRPVLGGLLTVDPAARLRAAQADAMLAELLPPEEPAAPAARRRGRAARPGDQGEEPRPGTLAIPGAAGASGAAGGPGRRRGVLVAAVAGGVVLAGALGGFALLRSTGASQAAPAAVASGGPSPAVTVAATPAPTPSPTAPARLPLKWYRPGTGWEAAVPKGWKRTDHTDYQEWSAPDGSGHLRISVIDWGGQDPLIVLQDAESNLSASVRSYRKIRMERIEFKDAKAAEWEARWKASGLRPYPWSVKNTVYRELRRVIWTGKTTTILTWVTPEAKWAELRPTMRAVLRLYRVPEGDLLPAPRTP